MSRPTPDRPDQDEEFLSRLVSEAGDPTVEPRPEHVADLRARILDRLGPPRTDRDLKAWRLVIPGLVAACWLAVLVRPRGDGKDPVVGHPGRSSTGGIVPDRGRTPPASPPGGMPDRASMCPDCPDSPGRFRDRRPLRS